LEATKALRQALGDSPPVSNWRRGSAICDDKVKVILFGAPKSIGSSPAGERAVTGLPNLLPRRQK